MAQCSPTSHKYRIRLAGGWKVKVRYIFAESLEAATKRAKQTYTVIRHVRRACACKGVQS